MGICSSKTATSPTTVTVAEQQSSVQEPLQIDPNNLEDQEPDQTSPALPKFIIQDIPAEIPTSYVAQHHDLLLDEPAMDESALLKIAANEEAQNTAKLREKQYEELAKKNKIVQSPQQIKPVDQVDTAEKPKRRVKGVLAQAAKKTKEYEFNDDKEAQKVANKGRSVFDQIEQQENLQMKEQALKRPGSAGGREKKIDIE